MALRIHFTDEDLTRVRFLAGPHPLWEVLLALHMFRSACGDPVFGGWQREVGDRLRLTAERPVRVLAKLAPPRGYSPDFLTPVPGPGARSAPGAAAAVGVPGAPSAVPVDLRSGIDAVLRTPRTALRSDLIRLAAEHPRGVAGLRRLAAGDPEALRQLGVAIEAFHRVAVEPYEAAMRRSLDADRALRGRVLLDGGVERLLTTLGADIVWQPPELLVPDYPGADRRVRLEGRGLLLIPSFFCWRMPITLADPALPPVLVYPVARDPGWIVHDEGAEPVALEALLGRARAVVLRTLRTVDRELNTTQLARRTGLSVAGASQHAAVLRAAGLIVSRRQGKSVHHSLSALGAALLHRNGAVRVLPGPFAAGTATADAAAAPGAGGPGAGARSPS